MWARVVSHTYYGPDTVIQLALDSEPGTVVKARTFAHDFPTEGKLVELFVCGPVVAYPRAAQANGRPPADKAIAEPGSHT